MNYLRQLIGFVAIVSINVTAQESYYDFIALGKNQIGYCDTLLFDEEIDYSQYNYSGAAPLFVQIWFPIKKTKNNNFMTWGDYRYRNIPVNLKDVYSELTSRLDESFIEYNIANDIVDDEAIDYGNLTHDEILKKLKKTPTKTIHSGLTKKSYPVIVYHHGSQGLSDENSIMAEYFASHGYIFVSSNFHLPYPDMPFGLLPYELEIKSKHNQSSAKKVLAFARTLAEDKGVYFVGHSWGAQEGWCFLNEENYADAFVSMETTIEFGNDSLHIKDFWPSVYAAIKVKQNQFSIPILHFAATEEDKGFDFFKNLTSAENIQAAIKEPFAHNSYTSIYMMRYFLHHQINQPDIEILKSQISIYVAHLEFVLGFLNHLESKKPFDNARFEDQFYIN